MLVHLDYVYFYRNSREYVFGNAVVIIAKVPLIRYDYCKTLGSVDNSNIVQYSHTLRPAACPRDVGDRELNCQQTLVNE